MRKSITNYKRSGNEYKGATLRGRRLYVDSFDGVLDVAERLIKELVKKM